MIVESGLPVGVIGELLSAALLLPPEYSTAAGVLGALLPPSLLVGVTGACEL